MEAAKRYMNEAVSGIEKAASVMNSSNPTSLPLPVTNHEIRRYVYDLLSTDEQSACDMATD